MLVPAMADPATAGKAAAKRRLTVYTVLVGAKEALNNPLEILPPGATTDLDLDFVCLTDNPALRSPVWRFVLLEDLHLPPEKMSRRAKAMPHVYFPPEAVADGGTESAAVSTHSLYIDNTVAFKRLPQAADLATDRPYLLRAFRHARHSQLAQEAYAISLLGYDDVATVCGQLAFYAQRAPLPELASLTTGTVLLREHHHPVVQHFGRLWWESILAFSKRDQLSLDTALHLAGAVVDYWPGITRDNPFIRWQGSLSPDRVRASFDGKRYAWQHRSEPAARHDPKAHALENGRSADASCQRPTRVFEFLCFQQGSSLGAQVSPRRSVADALEALLAAHRHEGARCLIVRVQDSGGPLAFDAEEADAAGRALSLYLGPAVHMGLLDLSAADLADVAKVYTARQQVPYSLVVVLGALPAQLAAVSQKLVRLLAPGQGALVALLSAPATLAQASVAEALMADVLAATVQCAVYPSWHDSSAQAVPNTLLGFAWGRST